MVEQDTIKLLRECDAGVKMGIASIDDVLDYVKSQKLKDFLIDLKVPAYLRDSLPILCSDNTIAALIGTRTGELFKIDNQTKNILKITRGTYDEN